MLLVGAVRSQTTPTPAVTATTVGDDVTTPSMLSTTTPGCSTLNISSCEACAPGTYYDNGENGLFVLK